MLATSVYVVGWRVAPSAHAVDEDRPVGDWNMQGGSNSMESKWANVPGMFRGNDAVRVVALQEAGSNPPGGATLTDRVIRGHHTEYTWPVGSDPYVLNIYWGDTGQQRNGLAIVSPDTARDQVMLQQEGTFADSARPILGVQFDNGTDAQGHARHIWYFTAHALSRGPTRPNDARDIIATAANWMGRNAPGQDWMVIGDFNRDPAQLPDGYQAHIARTNEATQQSGGELDYAYLSERVHGQFTTRRAWNFISDHFPIRVARNGNCQRDTSCSGPFYGETYIFTTPYDGNARAINSTPGHPLSADVWHGDADKHEIIRVMYSSNDEKGLVNLKFIPTTDAVDHDYLGRDSTYCLQRDNTNHHPDEVKAFYCTDGAKDQDWMMVSDGNGVRFIDPYAADDNHNLALDTTPNKAGVIGLASSTKVTYWTPNGVTDPEPNNGGFDDAPSGNLKKRDLRVMPLGDSITWGYGSRSTAGYRADLYGDLQDEAKSVDFVGSQDNGDGMTDQDNEGHKGWRIDQVAHVADCSVPLAKPNVILLHVGTNDMNQQFKLDTAVDRLRGLIDQALADAPGATVLVAKIIASSKAGMQPRIDALNAKLPDAIHQEQGQGKHVMSVDMSHLLESGDYFNASHPNESGYAKMAVVWNKGIERAEELGWITKPTGTVGDLSKCAGDDGGDAADATAAGTGWKPLGVVAPGMGAAGSAASSGYTMADLDGDGRADYVEIFADGSVRAAVNRPGKPGKPTWQDWGTITNAPGSADFNANADLADGEKVTGDMVRFADIDGDGRDDYLVIDDKNRVHEWRNTPSPDGTMLLIPTGDLMPDAGQVIIPGVGEPRDAVRFADVNGDGRDDYLIVGPKGSITAYFNNPKLDASVEPTFEKHENFAGGVAGGSRDHLRLADVNGDSKADYLIVGNTGAVHAYINKGGGTGGWEKHLYYVNQTNYPGANVRFFDISGDGKADYLVIYRGGSIRMWLNRGGNPTTN
ncbi:FG-GAP-like repeat-containing protein [Streptomyces sp. NPDC057199]|uniref:FG-GAP-like repeat-containing protein n=1 Tax=Streptomyces sp. NPDC057199 TaxID=3346047 RepID=UPI0036390A11